MSDFGLTLCLLPYFMYANSEGSGETARISTIMSCAVSSIVLDRTMCSFMFYDHVLSVIKHMFCHKTASLNGLMYTIV